MHEAHCEIYQSILDVWVAQMDMPFHSGKHVFFFLFYDLLFLEMTKCAFCKIDGVSHIFHIFSHDQKEAFDC